jgi:nicotinamide riboside kinase
MKVINLYGGPGCGKSTTAAGVFSALKQRGINCEYVHEWIKWSVWEKRTVIFDDQLYIFAKQHHMLHTLRGQVDVAICDSPLLLSNIYGLLYDNGSMRGKESFFSLVEETYNSFDNTNIMLGREKSYNPMGRVQTEDQAKELDGTIKDYLTGNSHEYLEVQGNAEAIPVLTEFICDQLNTRGQRP